MRGDIAWVSTPRLVERAAAEFPEVDAIVDGEWRCTYSELVELMWASARAALAAGIGHGDRAAVWAPNCAEWIVAALGIQAVGGILVPINTRFKGSEAAWVLSKSGARALFTVNGFLGVDYTQMLQESGTPLPALEQIVILQGPATEGARAWPDHLALGEAIEAERAEAAARAVTENDVADILFTSGTTGQPKGAMSTHGQNLRVFEVYTAALGLREGDRYLIVNPFFHSFGYKAGWLSCIMRGATIIPQAVFDPTDVMEQIERERVTVLPGPPTLLQGLLDHPDRDRYDLSSLRLTITGAASVPVELVRRLQTETSFETVLTGYGLTETSAVVAVCQHDDDPETIAHWSGRPIPDIEVKVVDDAGIEVPRGQPGEILVRGYNVMRGYWDDPAQTAETIDPDGWLHTGDIGVMDERSYLRVTDRKKDMFIVGGFNAYPAEIENLLLSDDRLALAAVVGVPDARLGEVGMAFVTPRPGVDVTPDEIIERARNNMANFKVPRYVEVLSELPVTASGKVLKYELRERGRLVAQARSAEDDQPAP